MAIKIKILKEGERVLNVWQDGIATRIVVQKPNGEACIYAISLDDNNLPRINPERSWIVAFGDNEIEADFCGDTSSDNNEEDIENNQNYQVESIKTF